MARVWQPDKARGWGLPSAPVEMYLKSTLAGDPFTDKELAESGGVVPLVSAKPPRCQRIVKQKIKDMVIAETVTNLVNVNNTICH